MGSVSEIAPRVMGPADRRRIFKALDEVYDIGRERYCDGTTDHSLAAAMDVPRAWVEEIRDGNFGPCGENIEMDRVASVIGKLAADVAALEKSGLVIAEQAEALALQVQATKKALEKIRTAVGPRAAAK